MMQRECDVCGRRFDAKTERRRYCSSTCRSRACRAPIVPISAAPSAPPDQVGGVTGAAYRELVAADRLETTDGQAVMALARRLDANRDTGSAMATLARQLRDAMTAAMRGAPRPDSVIDELKRKRLQRLNAGHGE